MARPHHPRNDHLGLPLHPLTGGIPGTRSDVSSELDGGSPTVGGEDPTCGHLYSRYCRPKVATFLEALGLDVEYIRAEGNTLYYRGNGGALVPVIDFLGGYGSLLFGHNHSRLVDAAT